ncbi:MAG: protein kinase [Eubacterium sp.]|nr:protein kinase [Eubacterium sp.]
MLEDIVESALYTEIKELKDGKKIVMDPETEKLYYRKSLSVFSVPVYRFLKYHEHPAIPRIKTFWQEEGKLVVIEDLIQGRTLEELLDKRCEKSDDKRLAESVSYYTDDDTEDDKNKHSITSSKYGSMIKEEAGEVLGFEKKKNILLEICDGLIFLHEAQPPIIHRDIKASNIMITDEGHAMIIDYDAAKLYISGNEKDTVLIGTQGIAAPEQYGFAQSDQRTDIYAFGKLIEKVLPESEQALHIVEKATRFKPSERYKDVRTMRAELAKMWDPRISRSEHSKAVLKAKFRSMTKEKSFKIAVIVLILGITISIGKIHFDKYIYPEYFVRRPAYEKAEKAMNKGEYEKAEEYLEKCGLEYKNSSELYAECEKKLYEAEQTRLREKYLDDYEEAKRAYIAADGYANTELSNLLNQLKTISTSGLQGDWNKEIEDIVIDKVRTNLIEGGTGAAKGVFSTFETKAKNIPGLSDDVDEMIFRFAGVLSDYEYYYDAYRKYIEISDYGDSRDRAMAVFNIALEKYKSDGEIMEAIKFADNVISVTKDGALRDDIMEKRYDLYYLYGNKMMNEGDYKQAVIYFQKDYKDERSRSRINDAKYNYCMKYKDSPDETFKKYIKELVAADYPGMADLQQEMENYTVTVSVEYRGTYMVAIDYTAQNKYGNSNLEYSAYIYKDDGTLTIDKLRGNKSRLFTSTGEEELYYHIDRIEVYDTEGRLLTTWRR